MLHRLTQNFCYISPISCSKTGSQLLLHSLNNRLFQKHNIVFINALYCSISSSACSSDSFLQPYEEPAAVIGDKCKYRWGHADFVFKYKLDNCSKRNNLIEALTLYDDAKRNGLHISLYHYNSLLYLCSTSFPLFDRVESHGVSPEKWCNDVSLKRGLEIYGHMVADKVVPNESTFTSLARLAWRMDDPDTAFLLVKEMEKMGIKAKPRSYEPALFGFCKKVAADEAYEVYNHMVDSGVLVDENGAAALLKVTMDIRNPERVYEMLQLLRSTTRTVSESTAKIVVDWFNSEIAANCGNNNSDFLKIREGAEKGGWWWHGQGWLGSGKWNVKRTHIKENATCSACSERLVCIDVDPIETDNFANSIFKLAFQREKAEKFKKFQEWLELHGPFDAIVDGANVGLMTKRAFSFKMLNSVVNILREMSLLKRPPLVILHEIRVHNGPARNPHNMALLENWRKIGALYTTPSGSNDDWYWLYAAVKCKCLVVTNDEMRDHLFQLLGDSFFPIWKERHQVRFSLSESGIVLKMPPSYSIVIQESITGSWHVPTVTGDDLSVPREWICASRSRIS